MKIMLAFLAVGLLLIVVLGFLFVRWANRPENVEALQQERAKKEAQRVEDEKNRAARQQEIEAKKSRLQLVIDENFADAGFAAFDYKLAGDHSFKVENNEFKFNTLITKGQNAYAYYVLSKEDFGDFAAEVEMAVWGANAFAGVVWDAAPNGNNSPKNYQAAYSSPNYMYVRTDGVQNFKLGGFIASENRQTLRVERFGPSLKISVNGKTFFDQEVAATGSGKVGIYLAHGGGGEYPQSISVSIKRFQVWR